MDPQHWWILLTYGHDRNGVQQGVSADSELDRADAGETPRSGSAGRNPWLQTPAGLFRFRSPHFCEGRYISNIPKPPLMQLGLDEISEFENLNSAGVTYLDTFFSQPDLRQNEAHHFH